MAILHENLKPYQRFVRGIRKAIPNPPVLVSGMSSRRIIPFNTTRRDSAGVVILTASTAPLSPNDSSSQISVWLGSLPADSESFGFFELFDFGWPLGLPGPRQLGITGLQQFSDFDPSCPWWGVFSGSDFSSQETWPWTLADSATVTVANGKIKVVIPQVLAGLLGPCGDDSPYLRAVIQEK
jgi:hypothetical protein